MPLPLSSSLDGEMTRGDFGARVDGAFLCVPENMMKVADALGARSAEHLYLFAHSFPSAVAQMLGWQREEVMQAREKLKVLLEGIIDEAILDPVAHEERTYGALPPDS